MHYAQDYARSYPRLVCELTTCVIVRFLLEGKRFPQLIIATLLSLFGIALLGAAFITAPPGEIHSSVLIAYGEVMTFAGALFGIDYHYRR